MKFIIAVVMFALAAVNTNANLLPLQYALPYSLPWAYAPRGISLSQGLATYGAPTVVSTYHAPVAVAAPALANYAVAAPAVVPSASYVASTRGATHVAPLPGHIESVLSQNLEPAAGTL